MAVDYLREKFSNIYFIAIEPAIKLAYDMSCDGTLIMATKGTMDSERFHLLYDKYHHDNFYLLSCVGLANLIESGNKDSIINYLESHLSQYKGKVSNVVLGCTHYPLIKREISKVLADTISSDKFVEELSWLLPVGFKEELFIVPEYGSLIKGLSEEKITDTIPAKGYPIYLNYLNDDPIVIERPITTGLLRDCVCKRLFVDGQENIYAVAFYTFSNFKLTVDKKNLFSGIKVYIDNMLLCDENELLSVLKNLNLTTSTQNELMVSVKAVGVMLYIVDKVNLSANARRTFIDITDNEALAFLKLISSFITEIYDLRYALSKYAVGIDKYQANVSKVEDLRNNAQAALDQLSQETVKLPAFSQERHTKFEDLSISEQKKIVKGIILAKINEFIKSYFAAATEFKEISAFEDFKTWLLK